MDFIKVYTVVPANTLVSFAAICNKPSTINNICMRFRMNKAFIIAPRTKPYFYIVNLNNTLANDGPKNFNLLMSTARYRRRETIATSYFIVTFYLTSAPIGFNDQRPYFLETNKDRFQVILDFPLTSANTFAYSTNTAYNTQAFNGERFALFRAGQYIVSPLTETVPYQGVQQYLSTLMPKNWIGPPNCYQSNTNNNIVTSSTGYFTYSQLDNSLFTLRLNNGNSILLFYMIRPQWSRMTMGMADEDSILSINNEILLKIEIEADNPDFLSNQFTSNNRYPYPTLKSGSAVITDILGYFAEIAPIRSNQYFDYAPVTRPIAIMRRVGFADKYEIAGYTENFSWNATTSFLLATLNPSWQDTIIPIETFTWPSTLYSNVRSIMRMGDGNICRDLRLETLHDVNRVECFTFNLNQYSPYVSLILSGVRYVRPPGEDPDFIGYNGRNPIGQLLVEGTSILESTGSPPVVTQDLETISSNTAKIWTQEAFKNFNCRPLNFPQRTFDVTDKMDMAFNLFQRTSYFVPTKPEIYQHYVQSPRNLWSAKNYSFAGYGDFIAPVIGQVATLIENTSGSLKFWAHEHTTLPQLNVTVMVDYDNYQTNISQQTFILPSFTPITANVIQWLDTQIHYDGFITPGLLDMISLKNMTNIPPQPSITQTIQVVSQFNQRNTNTLVTHLTQGPILKEPFVPTRYGRVTFDGQLNSVIQVNYTLFNINDPLFLHYIFEIPISTAVYSDPIGNQSWLIDWSNVRPYPLYGKYNTQIDANWQSQNPNQSANGNDQTINYCIVDTQNRVRYWRNLITNVNFTTGNTNCYCGAAELLSFPGLTTSPGFRIIAWFAKSPDGVNFIYPTEFAIKSIAKPEAALCAGFLYDTISYAGTNYNKFLRYASDGPFSTQYNLSIDVAPFVSFSTLRCSTRTFTVPQWASEVLFSTLWQNLPAATFTIQASLFAGGYNYLQPMTMNLRSYVASGQTHSELLVETMTGNSTFLPESTYRQISGINFATPSTCANLSIGTPPVGTNCIFLQLPFGNINIGPSSQNARWGDLYWAYGNVVPATLTINANASFLRSFSYQPYPFIETQREGVIYFHKPLNLSTRQTITPGQNWLVHIVKVTQEVLIQVNNQTPTYIYMRSVVASLEYNALGYYLNLYDSNHYLEYEINGIVDVAEDLIPLSFQNVRLDTNFTFQMGRYVNQTGLIHCDSVFQANNMNIAIQKDAGLLASTPTLGQTINFTVLPITNPAVLSVKYVIPTNGLNLAWRSPTGVFRFAMGYPVNICDAFIQKPRTDSTFGFRVIFPDLKNSCSFYGLDDAGQILEIRNAPYATPWDLNDQFKNTNPPERVNQDGGWEFLLTNVNIKQVVVIWTFPSPSFRPYFESPPPLTIRQIPWFENAGKYSVVGTDINDLSLTMIKSSNPTVQANLVNQTTLGSPIFRGSPMMYTGLYGTGIPFNMNFKIYEQWKFEAMLNGAQPNDNPELIFKWYLKNLLPNATYQYDSCTRTSQQVNAINRTSENLQGRLVLDRNVASSLFTGNYFSAEISGVQNTTGYMLRYNQLWDIDDNNPINPYMNFALTFQNNTTFAFSETPWPFTGTNAPRFPRFYTMNYDKWHLGPSRVYIPFTNTYNILLLSGVLQYRFVRILQTTSLSGDNQTKTIYTREAVEEITNVNTSFVINAANTTQYITFEVPQAASDTYRLETQINGDLTFNLADWTKCLVWTSYPGALQLAQNYLYLTKGVTNTDYSFQTLDTTDDLFMYNIFVENKAANIPLSFNQRINEGPLGTAGLTVTVTVNFYKSVDNIITTIHTQTVSSINRTITINPFAITTPSGYDRCFIRFRVRNILTQKSMVNWIMNMTYLQGIRGLVMLVCNSSNLILREYVEPLAVTDNEVSVSAVRFENVQLDAKLIFYMNANSVSNLVNPLTAMFSFNCYQKVLFPTSTIVEHYSRPSLTLPCYELDYNKPVVARPFENLCVVNQKYCNLYNELDLPGSAWESQLTSRVNASGGSHNLIATNIANPPVINYGTAVWQLRQGISFTGPIADGFVMQNGFKLGVDQQPSNPAWNQFVHLFNLLGIQAPNYRNLPTLSNPQKHDYYRFIVKNTSLKTYATGTGVSDEPLWDNPTGQAAALWLYEVADFKEANVEKYIMIFSSQITNRPTAYVSISSRVSEDVNNMIDNLWVRTMSVYNEAVIYRSRQANGNRWVCEFPPIPANTRLCVNWGVTYNWGATGQPSSSVLRVYRNSNIAAVTAFNPIPFGSPLTIDTKFHTYAVKMTVLEPLIRNCIANSSVSTIRFLKELLPTVTTLNPGSLTIRMYTISSVNQRVLFKSRAAVTYPYPATIDFPLGLADNLPEGLKYIYFELDFAAYSSAFQDTNTAPLEFTLQYKEEGVGKAGWGIEDRNAGENLCYTLDPELITTNYLSYLLQWSNTYTGIVNIEAYVGNANDRFIVNGINMYGSISGVPKQTRTVTGEVNSVTLEFDLRTVWFPGSNWVFSFSMEFEEPQTQVRQVTGSRFISDPNFTIYDALDNYIEVSTPVTDASWPFWANVLLQHPNAQFFIKLDLLLYGGKRDYIWQQFKYISAVTAKRGDHARISNQLVLTDVVDNYGYEGSNWHLLYSRYNREEQALWRKFVKKTVAQFLVSFNPLEVTFERTTTPTYWDLALTRYLTLYFK